MEAERSIRQFETDGAKVMADLRSSEVNWATFCAAPDMVEAVKMPSLFPIPTHIVRRRITQTFDAEETPSLMWSPEYVYGQGVLVGRKKGAASAFVNIHDVVEGAAAVSMTAAEYGVLKSSDWDGLSYPGVGLVNYPFSVTPPLTDSLSAGGARLIGASLEIEYLGRIDDIQGIIEIAMNTNTANTKRTLAPLQDMAFFSQDAIQQAPYYKRYRLSDGVRTIWIPLDESRFDFNECYQLYDRVETQTLVSGSDAFAVSGAGDGYRAFIYPTKHNAGLHGGYNNQNYIPPGAHDNMKYNDPSKAHRQDNDDLHSRVRIEWGINFVGLNQKTPVRIYINQYYETIPHESQMDNYFPTRGPRGNSDVSIKLIQQVIGDITPTPSRSSFGGLMSNVFSKILDTAISFGKSAIPGLLSGGPVGGIVSGTLGGITESGLLGGGAKMLSSFLNKSQLSSG